MPRKATSNQVIAPLVSTTLEPWEEELLTVTATNRRYKIAARAFERFEYDFAYGYVTRYVGGHPVDFKKMTEARTTNKSAQKRRLRDEDEGAMREGR